MADEKTYELIARYLSGESDALENAHVQERLQNDPEFRALYIEVKADWEAVSSARQQFQPSVDEAWRRFSRETPAVHPAGKRYGFMMLASAAAVALIAVVWFMRGGGDTATVTLAGQDAPKAFDLPDGSKVTLNKGAELRYAEGLAGDTREVELTGEATFAVAKDADHPFEVKANGTVTRVLGTEFNLRAVPGSDSVEVTLFEGKVQFSHDKKGVILKPGQSAVFRDGEISLRQGAPEWKRQWTEGRIKFAGESMLEVSEALRGYYGIAVIWDNEAIGRCTYHGAFRADGLEDGVKALSQSLLLDYELKNDTLRLKGEGCP